MKDTPLYLTAMDASRILDIGAAQVRDLAKRGKIPVAARTVGGIRLFRREDILALVKQRRRERRYPR